MRISAVIFIIVALTAVIQPTSVNLGWFEPFDAYASGVLLSLSAVVLAASLVLSRITPMGYFRFACPTGRLLDYTRRDASRYQLTVLDAAVVTAAFCVWATPWVLIF
jgi:hypothetical protein